MLTVCSVFHKQQERNRGVTGPANLVAGRGGGDSAWRRRRRVILFSFFCASTVLTVCSVFHKHQIVTEGENHLTDQIGRRGAVVALTSFLFPARGGGRRRTRRAPRGRKNEVNATTARPPAGGGGGIIDEAARLDWPGSDEGPRRAPVFFLVQSNCFYFFVHRLLGI